jgi:hypothetical protein
MALINSPFSWHASTHLCVAPLERAGGRALAPLRPDLGCPGHESFPVNTAAPADPGSSRRPVGGPSAFAPGRRIVADEATTERLLHPGSWDPKQKPRGDLDSPATDLSVRGSGSASGSAQTSALVSSGREVAGIGGPDWATSRAAAWRGRSLALPPSRDSSGEDLVGGLCRSGNRSACHQPMSSARRSSLTGR